MAPWKQYCYLAYQAELLGHYQLSDVILDECPEPPKKKRIPFYVPSFRDKLVAHRKSGEHPRQVSIQLLTE